MEVDMYGNCTDCGCYARLTPGKLCKDCETIDQQMLQQARETLRQEGRKTVFELSEQLSILPKKVFQWLEQRKLGTHMFKHVCPFCGGDILNNTCECVALLKRSEKPATNPQAKFHSALRVQERRRRYWEQKSNIRKKQKKDIWFIT
jgi:hypothetical protein